MECNYCPKCGKPVTAGSIYCAICGTFLNQDVDRFVSTIYKTNKTPTPDEGEVYQCCPKCGSRNLHASEKGFSVTKTVAGGVLFGRVGLLAGTLGSKDVIVTCLGCGKKFKAGELRTIRNARR